MSDFPDPRIVRLQMFSWVGEDETGGVGIKTISTPLGIFAANSIRESNMRIPVVVAQVKLQALALRKPVYLVRFNFDAVIERVNP